DGCGGTTASSAMRAPSGSRPGQKRRAASVLIIATAALADVSAAEKLRPRVSGMRIVGRKSPPIVERATSGRSSTRKSESPATVRRTIACAWRNADFGAVRIIWRSCYDSSVRELAILLLHVFATVVRLAGPGGVRAVVAESVLVKQQLLILNRSRKRAPHLRLTDRVIAGVCALFIRPGRLARSAIVLKPSTLARFHRALTVRKDRQLFSSPGRKKPGPKGPSQEVMAAIVEMKQRNPTWGCPRIAQQITSDCAASSPRWRP